MADIFISYAREDRASAERLANALEEQGWSVWWDPQIPAGKTFDDVIEQAIDTASCILVLWSKHSVKSRWVRTEATEGLDRGILVPVLIEDVRPPLAFRRIQAANLIEWDGLASHSAFKKLVSDIAGILGPLLTDEAKERNKTREQAAQDKAEAVPYSRKKTPDSPGVPSVSLSSLSKIIFLLGGSILIIVILMVVMFPSEREPVPESQAPVAEAPGKALEPPKLVTPPSPDQDPTSDATPGDLQLSQAQWREVQQALSDIGFDAGANDGMPGAKTISAIALFQEERGFSASGQLSDAQLNRLLADARLAAEGRLVSTPEPAVNSVKLPEMIEIPAGCFQMGSPANEEGRGDDERQHEVCVEAFKIGKTEVTQQQWREVMGNNPSQFWGCDNCPVERVNWTDVQEYLTKLFLKTGKHFRLPTEAEWEYAARAGTTGPFSFQGRISADMVNYNANDTYEGSDKGQYRNKTVPVGSLPANPWGLYEMHGNVSEWTCSVYAGQYGGGEKQCASNYERRKRVIRGGSWWNAPRVLRSANRTWFDPTILDTLGFRLVQSELD